MSADDEAELHLLERALEARSERLANVLDESRRRRLELAAAETRIERAEAHRAQAEERLLAATRARPGRYRRALRRVPFLVDVVHALRSRRRPGPTRSAAVVAGGPRPGERPLRASKTAEEALRQRILDGLPGGSPTRGPKVSIVILNRDGEAHLRRLLPALAGLAYRDVELVLVDNASQDGSVAYVRGRHLPFEVRIVENAENESFAAANNGAAAAASGDLVLFLNNDVLPMEPGWLGHLVETLGTSGAAACGARLVFPARPGPAYGPVEEPADLELQHAGITFRWIEGMPRPRNVGGSDPCDGAITGVRDVPAATAACLLVDRARFLAAGGFEEGYFYGYEDVDLCLRWRDAGERIVVDGRAVLWHDESATRRTASDRASIERQRANRQRFYARWGVRLLRDLLQEALAGDRFLAAEPLPITVVGAAPGDGSVDALVAELRDAGWQIRRAEVPPEGVVVDTEASVGIALVVSPGTDLRRVPRPVVAVGWVRDAVAAWAAAPWFDELDLVLARDADVAGALRSLVARRPVRFDPPTAPRLLELVAEWTAARRVGILIQARGWDDAPTSGDYHFARALQRQLERRGLPTSVYMRPAWSQPASARDDIAIHLWGRYPIGRRPGQTCLLWILYHPELVTDELLADYDLVLVASDRFAAELAPRSTAPVRSLHQATDPERFRPGLPGPTHELLFVGNARGIRRDVLHRLVPTEHELAVYGGGWDPEFLDPAYIRAASVPNEILSGYYSSAGIVLNDHWPEAAAAGFLNNRLYDALAAGGFVISDHVDGIEAEFDGGVVTYRDTAGLLRLVERYLADAPARAERSARGRAAVLARHTFGDRAEELLRLVDELRE